MVGRVHTHFSAVSAAQAFLAVVIIGGVWRLSAAHLVSASHPTAQLVGKTMLFQY